MGRGFFVVQRLWVEDCWVVESLSGPGHMQVQNVYSEALAAASMRACWLLKSVGVMEEDSGVKNRYWQVAKEVFVFSEMWTRSGCPEPGFALLALIWKLLKASSIDAIVHLPPCFALSFNLLTPVTELLQFLIVACRDSFPAWGKQVLSGTLMDYFPPLFSAVPLGWCGLWWPSGHGVECGCSPAGVHSVGETPLGLAFLGWDLWQYLGWKLQCPGWAVSSSWLSWSLMHVATVTISGSLKSPFPTLNFEAYSRLDAQSQIHNLCQGI